SPYTRVLIVVSLLYYLVRSQQKRRRDRQPERLGGLEVDHQLERGGLLDGQVSRIRALQNLVDKHGGAPMQLDDVSTISHDGTAFGELGSPGDAQQSVLRRRPGDVNPLSVEGAVGKHDDRPRLVLSRRRE